MHRRASSRRRVGGRRHCDGAPNRSERGLLVEDHFAVDHAYTELAPERVEVDVDRCRAHLFVELHEHRYADRRVTLLQRAGQRPDRLDVAAVLENAAQRVLQAEVVCGALADLDVGQQTEQGPAPVGPAPGGGVVQSAIAAPRQPLREPNHEVAPHPFGAQLPGLCARNGLDVGGYPFLDPVVLHGHAWEGQMYHLMGQHPVHCQLVGVAAAPYVHADLRRAEAESGAGLRAQAIGRFDVHSQPLHREATVVDLHRGGGIPHPLLEVGVAHAQLAGAVRDDDHVVVGVQLQRAHARGVQRRRAAAAAQQRGGGKRGEAARCDEESCRPSRCARRVFRRVPVPSHDRISGDACLPQEVLTFAGTPPPACSHHPVALRAPPLLRQDGSVFFSPPLTADSGRVPADSAKPLTYHQIQGGIPRVSAGGRARMLCGRRAQ